MIINIYIYIYEYIFLGETFPTTIRSRCCKNHIRVDDSARTKLYITSTNSSTAMGPSLVTNY